MSIAREVHPVKNNDEIGIGGLSVTRRALIVGTIVGADSLAAPQLPFDVRTHVPNSAHDDACIQCIYDTINRMVVLIGDLPFNQLFTQPMKEFVPVVRPRILTAASFGLIAHPDQVTTLADILAQQASLSTISDFFASPRSSFSAQIVSAFIALRRQGIRIPVPPSDSALTQDRREAVTQMISVAPTLTFEGLFTTVKETTPEPIIAALTTLQRFGLLAWFKNDRCCHGHVGAAATCEFAEGKLCILDGEQLHCTLISDEC